MEPQREQEPRIDKRSAGETVTVRPTLLAALFSGLAALGAQPVAAMCAGNIFATCPPPANAAASETARVKREKRLEAVRAKKRRYPLGSR